MKETCCVTCGSDLKVSEVRNKQRQCALCIAKGHLRTWFSCEFMATAFGQRWVKELFQRFGTFLETHEIPPQTQDRLVCKVLHILGQADTCFHSQQEIDETWLKTMVEQAQGHFAATVFHAFLLKEHLLTEEDREEKLIKAIQGKLAEIPLPYRRVVEVFLTERMSWRARQISQNARHPLTGKTLQANIELLSRLVRWLTTEQPDLTGWEAVQEEHIHAFLLTLTAKQREHVRKDLQLFFHLARKRRLIAHVPIMDAPAKELPPTLEPLRGEEQRALARLIGERSVSHPEEALLAALCFYHGLSSSQIRHLKTEQVDVEQGRIVMPDRPPVYLLAEDFQLLERFLRKRQTLPYAKSREYLFISNQAKLEDKPVSKGTLRLKVHSLTTYTPQCLRITCFTALSARYGSQYLVEAFGVSLTQAARYGNMQEFLLEEELKDQQEELMKLVRCLDETKTRRKKQEEIQESRRAELAACTEHE